jgi:nitrogen fixation NifU-like protein
MSDLRELYQQVILDHNKSPRNFNILEPADRKAEGYNPLCGDHYTVFLRMDGDTIREIGFQGSGCAISKASASVMTSIVKGKSTPDADATFQQFHDLVTGESQEPDLEKLGRLAAFAGVKEYPSRIKCATLPWHTLQNALRGENEVVSTET